MRPVFHKDPPVIAGTSDRQAKIVSVFIQNSTFMGLLTVTTAILLHFSIMKSFLSIRRQPGSRCRLLLHRDLILAFHL
jgi:hypothetical protein